MRSTATERGTIIVTPSAKGSKKNNFVRLLTSGRSIATTHSLFSRCDDNIIDLIQQNDYTLILDEALSTVQPINIAKKDIEILLKNEYIEQSEDYNVKILEKGLEYLHKKEEYAGVYDDILELSKTGRLIMYGGTMLLWEFPIRIMKSFNNIIILTYMFKGQTMYNYLKSHNIEMEFYYMENGVPVYGETKGEGLKYRDLISVYEGKMNLIGEKTTALSEGWFRKNKFYENHDVMATIRKNTTNYFLNIQKAKSDDLIWTTFKKYQDRLGHNGYKLGFVPSNMRSTNDYADRHNCAYLINKYENPVMLQYFLSKKVNIHPDVFALSELIQWLFRSAIRNGEAINVYIPSKRMRQLLIYWLDGKI
jgi:hypothetical protein